MFDRLLDGFFQRLLVLILLPNVLVIEFWASDANNYHNFFWYYLLGPYWHLEEFIAIGALVIAGGILVWLVLQRVPNLIAAFLEFKSDWHRAEEQYQIQQEYDRQKAAQIAKEEAAKMAFLALPVEERERIGKAQADSAQAEREYWVKARQEQIRQQNLEEQLAQRKKDQELERKRILENSPEYQREKALRDFTGGGIR